MVRLAFRASWWRPVAALLAWWARWPGMPRPPGSWRKTAGPYFGNAVATLDLHDREASVTFEFAQHSCGGPELVRLPPVPLT